MKIVMIISFLSSFSLFASCDFEYLVSKSNHPNTNFKVLVAVVKPDIKVYDQLLPLNKQVHQKLKDLTDSNEKICLNGTRKNRTLFIYSASRP